MAAAGLERRQRCPCATEEGLGRLDPLSPAALTAPSLILHPPLTNFLPSIHPALLHPSLPAAPGISLFLPQLTCAGTGNAAFNPNPRANQKGDKAAAGPSRLPLAAQEIGVSSSWIDQMLFVIHYPLMNSTAALGNGARRSVIPAMPLKGTGSAAAAAAGGAGGAGSAICGDD